MSSHFYGDPRVSHGCECLPHASLRSGHTALFHYLAGAVHHAIPAGFVSQVHADCDRVHTTCFSVSPRDFRFPCANVILLHAGLLFCTLSAFHRVAYRYPAGRPASHSITETTGSEMTSGWFF